MQTGSRISSMSTAPTQQEATLPSSPLPNQTLPVEDFKCNICLNIASDAVVTVCGHLFCWPCLYTWLHYHSRYKECPVCKGATSEARVIPIYSWGCKDADNSSKIHSNSNMSIPPRPPARRVESERQRRQRYQAERGRQMNQSVSEMHYPTLNQVLFGLNECGASSGGPDTHTPDNATASTTTNNNSNSNAANMNYHLMGRETRASWLERLRAMREERLVWPVAFVHGLTSRELLQQRRQAREHALSPRLSLNLAQQSPMVDANTNVAAWYCQSGQAQSGAALQRALSLASMDHDLGHLMHNQPMPAASASGGPNTNHTAQYLSTMSSILSSMEVFAKALELSSASSLSQSASSTSALLSATTMPHHMQAFNTPNEESAFWQSSMRGLLAQMERLTMQLQSIQPLTSSHSAPNHQMERLTMQLQSIQPLTSSHSAPNHHMLENNWVNMANVPTPHHHHHHHHHYHMDGSLSDRSAHVVNPLTERGFPEEGDMRCHAMNTSNVLGLSPRMSTQGDLNLNMANVASANAGHRGSQPSAVFPPHLHLARGAGRDNNISKSRKRWDVTRMST